MGCNEQIREDGTRRSKESLALFNPTFVFHPPVSLFVPLLPSSVSLPLSSSSTMWRKTNPYVTSEVSASESAPVRKAQPYEGLFWEERGGRQRVEMHQSHLLVLIIIILVAGSHQKPPKEIGASSLSTQWGTDVTFPSAKAAADQPPTLLSFPEGETGLLVMKITKNTPFHGYAGDSRMTEKKVLRDVLVKGDTFFNSGDLLMMDHERFIYFQDRVGDTFR